MCLIEHYLFMNKIKDYALGAGSGAGGATLLLLVHNLLEKAKGNTSTTSAFSFNVLLAGAILGVAEEAIRLAISDERSR